MVLFGQISEVTFLVILYEKFNTLKKTSFLHFTGENRYFFKG
jgi:hypothetical protein